MRPVNLLPQKHRPHKPTGSRAGSSYAVLGVLALFLLAAVTYVLESNKITRADSDIATAQQKTAAAKARSQQLGPFANFAQIKEQRVASVRQLAEGRFDWERTVRELAHVLPDGVWLRDFDASVAGDGSTGGSSAPSGGAASAAAGPSIKLHGCAYKQPRVAVLLVRLREMQGVKDVKLTDSTRTEDPDADRRAGAAAATGDSAPQRTDGCGVHNGRGNYEFNAVVEFNPPAPAAGGAPDAGKTPVRLGGGS
jgi:Tfp pilus assembly protein PilN